MLTEAAFDIQIASLELDALACVYTCLSVCKCLYTPNLCEGFHLSNLNWQKVQMIELANKYKQQAESKNWMKSFSSFKVTIPD